MSCRVVLCACHVASQCVSTAAVVIHAERCTRGLCHDHGTDTCQRLVCIASTPTWSFILTHDHILVVRGLLTQTYSGTFPDTETCMPHSCVLVWRRNSLARAKSTLCVCADIHTYACACAVSVLTRARAICWMRWRCLIDVHVPRLLSLPPLAHPTYCSAGADRVRTYYHGRYLFISNVDNLGATVDLKILYRLMVERSTFAMEVRSFVRSFVRSCGCRFVCGLD